MKVLSVTNNEDGIEVNLEIENPSIDYLTEQISKIEDKFSLEKHPIVWELKDKILNIKISPESDVDDSSISEFFE